MFRIETIQYPMVLIEDTDLSDERKHLISVSIREFNNSPMNNAEVERDKEGRWNVLSRVVDETCLNGVCNLKLPDNH